MCQIQSVYTGDATIAQIATWLQEFDAEIDYWNDGIAALMDSLEAHVRISVALDETTDQAEKRFRDAIYAAYRNDPWLSSNPPRKSRLASGFG